MYYLDVQDCKTIAAGEWCTLLPDSWVDDAGITAGAAWATLAVGLAVAANGARHHQYGARQFAKNAALSFVYMGTIAATSMFAYEYWTSN